MGHLDSDGWEWDGCLLAHDGVSNGHVRDAGDHHNIAYNE